MYTRRSGLGRYVRKRPKSYNVKKARRGTRFRGRKREKTFGDVFRCRNGRKSASYTDTTVRKVVVPNRGGHGGCVVVVGFRVFAATCARPRSRPPNRETTAPVLRRKRPRDGPDRTSATKRSGGTQLLLRTFRVKHGASFV